MEPESSTQSLGMCPSDFSNSGISPFIGATPSTKETLSIPTSYLQPSGPGSTASYCPKCLSPIWIQSQGRQLWEPIGQDERLPDLSAKRSMVMSIISLIMAIKIMVMDMVTSTMGMITGITTIIRNLTNPFAIKEITMAPERRIIQITNSVTGQNMNIVALCDDGSVWQYQFGSNSWAPLAPVPQV